MQIQGLLGEEGAKAIIGLIEQTASVKQGVIAGAIGAGLLVFGATTVCVELQDDLDRIWEVPARESGILSLIQERILSFGLILGVGFLLTMSLVISAALSAFGDWWSARLGLWEGVLQAINIVVSLGLTMMLFAMIYKILPRAPVAWNDVWIGAFVTAILIAVGRELIGLYLGRSAVSNDFGAAGSLVVVLIWVYYTAQIFLLGAEFTWAYAHRCGSKAEQINERLATRQGVD